MSRDVVFNELDMLYLKAKTVLESSTNVPTVGNIPVEVEDTSGPSQEYTHEPETNEELDVLASLLETDVPELENFNDDEDHPEAQAQALRDYQLSRDRARRMSGEPIRYGYSYIVSYVFAVISYVEEKEPSCFSNVLKSPNRSLWFHAMDEEICSLHKNKTRVLVPKPLKQKLIDCKWIFKIKEPESANEPPQFKVRLVTKSFS